MTLTHHFHAFCLGPVGHVLHYWTETHMQPLALALSAVELDSQTFQNRPFHKPYTPTKSSFDFSIESDRRNATTLKSFYDLTGKLLTLDTYDSSLK
ncbi:hypothetical protein MRB53_019263 [Persea americana]|uniref:Uncharacterized protein n=1 Tax=Persea americana TaxID=3435 RepID=A0ACC2KYJ4_PERAE|nr:hypothetical protein MRB53_019263 [Persea americana]